MATYNKFKSTRIYGNFINSDGSAYFYNDVSISGNINTSSIYATSYNGINSKNILCLSGLVSNVQTQLDSTLSGLIALKTKTDSMQFNTQNIVYSSVDGFTNITGNGGSCYGLFYHFGDVNCNNNCNIAGTGFLNFNYADTTKQADAGKIGYGFLDGYVGSNNLYIVGAGTSAPDRNVFIFDNLGIYQRLSVPQINLNGSDLQTSLDSFLNYNNLLVYASQTASNTKPTVVKGGTASNPTLTFTIPSLSLSSYIPSLSIGSVTTTTLPYFSANITGLSPNYFLNLTTPTFVSLSGLNTWTNVNTFLKVPIISSTLLSTDNSTKIATTNFVKSQGYLTYFTISSYVTFSSLSNYVLNSQLSNYVLSSSMYQYVLTSQLINYTLSSSLSQYALSSSLSNYALNSTLSNYTLASSMYQYTLNSQLINYTLSSSLSNYALSSSLSNYALNSTFNDYSTTSNILALLNSYAPLNNCTFPTAPTCTDTYTSSDITSKKLPTCELMYNTYQTQINTSNANVFTINTELTNRIGALNSSVTAAFTQLNALPTPPVGSVMMWLTGTPPNGWLLCDGSFLSTTLYAPLYAVIGSSYTTSIIAGKFQLPNFNGAFLRGVGTQTYNGTAYSGATSAGALSKQADEVKSHSHSYGYYTQDAFNDFVQFITTIPNTSWNVLGYSLSLGSLGFQRGLRSVQVGTGTTGVTTSTGGNETRPFNYSVYYIIKY